LEVIEETKLLRTAELERRDRRKPVCWRIVLDGRPSLWRRPASMPRTVGRAVEGVVPTIE